MHPKVIRMTVLAILTAGLLAACGQKGPLFLPEGNKPQAGPAQPLSAEEPERREKTEQDK